MAREAQLRKTLKSINKQLAAVRSRRKSLKKAFSKLKKHSKKRMSKKRRLTMAPGDSIYKRTVRHRRN